jgi:UDP-glucose 4-epimerase
MKKQMKILVTGGAGYIGSHVVYQLGKAGHDLVIYDNCSTGFESSILFGSLVKADLLDLGQLRSVFFEQNFDAVLHFAAKINAPKSIVMPIEYYENNSFSTLNLLKCCREFQVNKFIFSSTAAVYGEPSENPVSETATTLPINPYGSSKLFSEWMIRDFARSSDLRYVTLRYFNVAGADSSGKIGPMSPHATHLLKVACDAALGRRTHVEIFGTDFETPDGTGIRDYIHIEDLAAAHLSALTYLQQDATSQTLNCGYGHGYSVREVLTRVMAVAGVHFPVHEVAARPGDPACVTARADRIREILKWNPRFDNLDLIVESILSWENRGNLVI